MSPYITLLVVFSTRTVRRRLPALLTVVLISVGCAGLGSGPRVPGAVSSGPNADGDLRPIAIDLESVPDWALANTTRVDELEIGIGSGDTLDRATRLALQDVAARLSVSIDARLRDRYREQDGISVESLEQVIETRITGARFTGWERTRTARRGGVFWVEVRIDRARLVRDSLRDLSELSASIDLQIERARGSALRRLVALQTTAPERERAAALITLLETLDAGFERGAWDARRASWRRIDESARRSLIFEVQADAESKEIASWLESELADQRLSVRPGDCSIFPSASAANGNLANDTRRPSSDSWVTRDVSPQMETEPVCIDIRSEIVEADVASRHVTRIRSFFAVSESDGGVLHEHDLVGRGDSSSNRHRARRKALDDLRSRLGGSDLLYGLLLP
jgi:hypothetical protein